MTKLEAVLKRFVSDRDLPEACMALLDYYRIKFTEISPAILPVDFIFSEEFLGKNQNLISKIGQISVVGIASQDTFLSKERCQISLEEMERQMENEHYKEMAFFSIEVNTRLTRSDISILTRAFNRRMLYKPVVLFIRKDKYLSMSTCERSAYIRSGYEGEKVGKVTILRDINCENTHRGHKDILESLDISQCQSFSDVLSTWLQTFSNELLTKKFYENLYRWYQWAVDSSSGVTFPNILVGAKEDKVNNMSTSIIRLITRLLFVWFIKQKGLAPNCLFDEDSLSSILKDFDPQSTIEGNYYNAILQNLFFATLNKQVDYRTFADTTAENNPHEGVKTLFRDNDNNSWYNISHDKVLSIFRPIPFMNCGLFECLDRYANADIDTDEDCFLDGFSSLSLKENGHYVYRAFIPNRLFFAEEHQETVTVKDEHHRPQKERIKVLGLIPLLKKYQFTVEENTPTEVEVSLDPELLGQVFENLLATYNPETHTSARKSTGSFYTPRPIVEYMVKESLVAYLNSKIDSSKEHIWRALLSYGDTTFELSDTERRAVLEKILNCKVLDPACGSGAFPMGMLQQMVHIVQKIDPSNEMWRDLVLERTQQEINKLLMERKDSKDDNKEIEERRAEVMKAFDNSIDNPDYTRKLYIIRNCIYGSDSQPIAMLISKLRFFISLICEQDTHNMDMSDSAHNYGIDTLPNLETKFVAADSLASANVRRFEDDEWTIDKKLVKLKNELLEIRQSHFMANTQEKKFAKRVEDEQKRRDIHNYILNQRIQPNKEKIASYEARIKQLEDERKSVELEDFQDVTITTQASLFDEGQTKVVNMDVNKEARDRIDNQIRQLQREIKNEKNKENKADFVSAVHQITSWNPYDQIHPAPFFDPDWMFNVTEGFDIVIGNPPYFQTRKGKYSSLQYPYSEGKDTGKQNMYKLFVEHSYNNAKQDGIACMIVQSSLMCDISSKYTRELLLRHTCLKQMIEFPKTAPTREGQVFASVCQGTCIYLFKKCEPDENTFTLSVNNDCTTLNHMMTETVTQDTLLNFYPSDYAIPLLRPGEFPILAKIKLHSALLSKYYCEAVQGDLNLTNDAWQYLNVQSNVRLIRGRHIGDFFVDYNVDEFVLPSFKPNIVKDNQHHIFLVCQQITGMVDRKRLHFSLTNPSMTFLLGNSLNKIQLNDERDNFVIIALLNSQLLDWVFRKTSSNNHVNCYEIGQLPIIIPEGDSRHRIEELVREIIENKEKNQRADTRDLEFRLDNEVYNLYGINDDERDCIRKCYE